VVAQWENPRNFQYGDANSQCLSLWSYACAAVSGLAHLFTETALPIGPDSGRANAHWQKGETPPTACSVFLEDHTSLSVFGSSDKKGFVLKARYIIETEDDPAPHKLKRGISLDPPFSFLVARYLLWDIHLTIVVK
jgi:hypothetical protein